MNELYSWLTPVLLAILGAVGMFATKALMQMAKDLNEIKISVKGLATQQEAHEHKLDKHEEKIEELTHKYYTLNGIKK
jgi:uncharacterized OsmC-like protein